MPVAGLGQAHGRRVRALPRRPRDERGVRGDELLGLRIEPEAELVPEAHCAKKPQRIVREDARRDDADDPCLHVCPAPVRVGGLAAGQRDGDRVDREVPRGEVVLDRAAQRCEVDRPALLERNPPGSVALRERKGGAAGALPILARGSAWIADRDVEIDEVPPEQLVADSAADDPGLPAGEDVARELTHRAPRAARGTSSCRYHRRARS